VDYDVEAFDLFWDPARDPKTVRVYEFPEAARQKLLDFLPKNDRVSTTPFIRKSPLPPDDYKLLEEYRRVVWTFIGEAARLSNGLRAGEMTSAVMPWTASLAASPASPSAEGCHEPLSSAAMNHRKSARSCGARTGNGNFLKPRTGT
jgi:hypothetical protein